MTDLRSTNDVLRPGRDEAEEAVRTLIRWAGDDPDARGPARDAGARRALLRGVLRGLRQDPREILARTFSEVDGYDEMIVLKDIRFESHCEHHMVPIIGKAHIGYLPDQRVVGISKLARLVEVYAKRLQIQEKMTVQIADTLHEVLQPQGRRGGDRGGASVHDDARRAQARRRIGHQPHAGRVSRRPVDTARIPGGAGTNGVRRLAQYLTPPARVSLSGTCS